MSTKGRKLNALEQKIHQAALSASDMSISQKQVDILEVDPLKRTESLNFLLGAGLLKIRTDGKGGISYRAVGKKEVEIKRDLTAEEGLVLTHIQASSNEGIWTKHLKVKTELHQTVIDRCLKSLVQKQLIKAIKNVKYPTRKIYMLSHLEPSSAITGGPWYTDNELDTEFIKQLMDVCLGFIRKMSFPNSKSKPQSLYPLSSAPKYPTAEQIKSVVMKAGITDTALTVEHIEMLLNVLITDGEIEKIPAFGAALWEASVMADNPDSEEEDSRKRKQKKREKREAKRKREELSSLSSGSGSESDSNSKKKKRRKKRSKSKHASSSDESDSNSEESEDERRKPRNGAIIMDSDDFDLGGTYVYRAIRQERIDLGWSQAPCSACPQFDFCKDKGPVNPGECEYYGQWLKSEDTSLE